MKHFSRVAFGLFLVALSIPSARGDELQRTISVTGQGKATAPPDMATIHTGVITQAETASDGLSENNKALTKIMDVLKQHKIASKDIQTSNFDVRPEYERGPRGQHKPKIVGYRVSNQVRVRVRNLPDLGKILDSLVSSGSNQISGISFGIDDPEGIMNQARNRAVADAKSRAALYAHAAGVKVGKVVTISEQLREIPRPQMVGRAMMGQAAGAVPVATGEQEVRATVYMVFALGDED